MNGHEMESELIYRWIIELTHPSTRENALLQLSQKREGVENLAPMLWHSFGTIAALIQEIVSVYPLIIPPTLTALQSNRVCNALAIMQCLAVHPETKMLFLEAQIPYFLYPFLRTTSKEKPFEYLRLTSLGVIGSLVKADNPDVIAFLVSSKIIPLLLRIMETGSELPRTVATFTLQRILMDEGGLSHVCETFGRFSHVAVILGKLVLELASQPAPRLLKQVILCYLRLSDNQQAKEALRQCLPDQLQDSTFTTSLEEDKSIKQWQQRLMKNLEPSSDELMASMNSKRMFLFNSRSDVVNGQLRSNGMNYDLSFV